MHTTLTALISLLIITIMVNTTQTTDAADALTAAAAPAALQTVAAVARTLAAASIAPNTARAYSVACNAFDASGQELTDTGIAEYLAALHEAGRAPASAAQAVAALKFRARLARQPDPTGEQTARVMAGYRRTAHDRGRGQAPAMLADDLAAIVATARTPRPRARGMETADTAHQRGTVDIAIAGLLFHAGLRRSEVSALRAADVQSAAQTPGAVLVTVRTSKTNQDGSAADVRMVKNGAAAALLALAQDANPADALIGLSGQSVGRRLTLAARAAGVDRRLTGHSGRVGLASELTARGASTTDAMLAGGWKTARMVAHYSAGATAERGAVARFL